MVVREMRLGLGRIEMLSVLCIGMLKSVMEKSVPLLVIEREVFIEVYLSRVRISGRASRVGSDSDPPVRICTLHSSAFYPLPLFHSPAGRQVNYEAQDDVMVVLDAAFDAMD